LAAASIDLAWNERCRELGVLPEAIVFNDWVAPKPKPEALDDFAARLIGPDTAGAPNPVSLALLRRELPRFVDGEGPADGTFTGDLDEMRRWAPHLDNSYVAVQGPPGTGKTYSGAHLIAELIRSGQRVGVTAFSHSAIDNLLSAVVAGVPGARRPGAAESRATRARAAIWGSVGREVLGRQQDVCQRQVQPGGRNHLACSPGRIYAAHRWTR
jgi:hypothetical protein